MGVNNMGVVDAGQNNYVNWNDIDRVPSTQNEIGQENQMGVGDEV